MKNQNQNQNDKYPYSLSDGFSPPNSTNELRREFQSCKDRYNLRLVIIDYLELLNPSHEKRLVRENLNDLTRMARYDKIAVLVLSNETPGLLNGHYRSLKKEVQNTINIVEKRIL